MPRVCCRPEGRHLHGRDEIVDRHGEFTTAAALPQVAADRLEPDHAPGPILLCRREGTNTIETQS